MTSQEQISSSSYAYQTFVNTCRSPVTRQQYIKGLHYFMAYLGLPLDAYDRLLNKDVKTIQMNVCDFVVYLRKKGLSSASVSAYVAAVNKFNALNVDGIRDWMPLHTEMLKIWTLSVPAVKRDLLLLSKKDNLRK